MLNEEAVCARRRLFSGRARSKAVSHSADVNGSEEEQRENSLSGGQQTHPTGE
jgi:hypothetical protein